MRASSCRSTDREIYGVSIDLLGSITHTLEV
jgi:hypothetical protein